MASLPSAKNKRLRKARLLASCRRALVAAVLLLMTTPFSNSYIAGPLLADENFKRNAAAGKIIVAAGAAGAATLYFRSKSSTMMVDAAGVTGVSTRVSVDDSYQGEDPGEVGAEGNEEIASRSSTGASGVGSAAEEHGGKRPHQHQYDCATTTS
eukprot:gene21307-33569_t